MDKVTAAAQQITGDMVTTVAEQANDFVKDASDKAAFDKALTLGEQIANYTCDNLNAKIPTIVTSITDKAIDKLRTKIDSEEFTTDFIKVLQTKLLDGGEYEDKFLKKFDILFDMIIKDAKVRHDKKESGTDEIDRLKLEIAELNAKLNAPGVSQEGSGYHKRTKRSRKSGGKKTKRVRFSTKK